MSSIQESVQAFFDEAIRSRDQKIDELVREVRVLKASLGLNGMEKIVTIPEASTMTGFKYHEIKRSVEEGKIPTYGPSERVRKVKPSEVFSALRKA